MKKQMALCAIAVLAMSTSSWAALGMGDINFDGSLEVSGNSANNEQDLGGVKASNTGSNDHRGSTVTRVRLGMNAKVTEDVSGRIEVARNPDSAGNSAFYGSGATSVQGEQNNFLFQNAFVTIEDLWGTDVRLGRQYVGEAGDIVWNIGPKSDDNLSINSIDGVLVKCKEGKSSGTVWDRIHLELFTGKASESQVSNAQTDANVGTGDVNLSNIEAKLDVIPGGRVRTAVLMGDQSNSVATGDNNHLRIFRLGANGGVAENMVTYRAEYLQNFGTFNGAGATSDLKYKGNAIDLGVGFNSKDTPVGGFSLWANYFVASGDKDTTNNDDKSFHDFSSLGVNTSDRYFGEIFGKSNALGGGTPLGQGVNGVNSGLQGLGLEVFNLGVNYKPAFATKTWARLDYYMLSRAEDTQDSVNVGKKFGNEFDLTLGYNHTDNVGFEVGGAMLNSDEALDFGRTGTLNGTQQDTITKLFARAKVKWGGEEKQ